MAPADASRLQTVPRAKALTQYEMSVASDGASTLAIAYFSPRGFELIVRRPGRGFSRPWLIRPLDAGDSPTVEDLSSPRIAFGPDGTVLVAFESNDGTSPYEERVGPACCWRVYAAALRRDGRRLGPWRVSGREAGESSSVSSIAAGAGGRMAVSWWGPRGWSMRERGRGGWGAVREVGDEHGVRGILGFSGRRLVSVYAKGTSDGKTIVERRDGSGRPRLLTRIDRQFLGAEFGMDRNGGVVGVLGLDNADRSESYRYLLEHRPGGRTRVRDLNRRGAHLITHASGAAAVLDTGFDSARVQARLRRPGARFGPWVDLAYPTAAGATFGSLQGTLSRGGRLSGWRERYRIGDETKELYLAQALRRGGRARLVRRIPGGTRFAGVTEDRRGPIAALLDDRQRIQLLRP